MSKYLQLVTQSLLTINESELKRAKEFAEETGTYSYLVIAAAMVAVADSSSWINRAMCVHQILVMGFNQAPEHLVEEWSGALAECEARLDRAHETYETEGDDGGELELVKLVEEGIYAIIELEKSSVTVEEVANATVH